jgi:putative lipoprotein
MRRRVVAWPRVVALAAFVIAPSTQAAEQGAVAYHDAPRTLYRGTLTQQEDRLLLSPCGGGRVVRVRDVSPEVIITAAITDIGFDRVKRLHFEAYGRMRDGELMIDRLNRAGVEMGCPKSRIGLRAQGNEPGWRLETGRAGVTWSLQGEAPLRTPAAALTWQWLHGDQHRPQATLEVATQGVALSAVLTPKICRDTMADAVYGFTAQVRQSRPQPAADFKGCAYLDSERLR